MEELKEKAKDLADHAGDFADTFYRLALVNATQKAAHIGSGAVLGIIAAVLGFFCLFFMACALAWWIGNLVESRALGFLITGAFFLLVVVLLFYFRKKTILPLMRDAIVRKLYESDN
jgi:hypothetical protein